MKPTDVFCKCENRQFTERQQGLLINEDHVLVISDTGLTVWTYATEEGRIIVDSDRDTIILSLDLNDLNKPQNLEAAKFAKMSFPDFIQYLLSWDGGEVDVGLKPGDHVYEISEGFISRVEHVHPNGSITTTAGNLLAKSDYHILNEEELVLVEKLAKSIRTTCDMADGYKVGTLIVESNSVYLEGEHGKTELQPYDTIEVYNGEQVDRLTYDEVQYTFSNDGWPAYAGLRARYRPIVLTPLTKEDFKR
ncbi:hypothetical protein [Rossellomorea aquimaris]|uniref:hypothetical protein n=1 Tax=Rossellomorea aquimaris TaxID=189382 RepID=UPI001CFCDA00|nr:hypothetical protein [Rossellomorea aquimaris]